MNEAKTEEILVKLILEIQRQKVEIAQLKEIVGNMLKNQQPIDEQYV